MIHNEFRFTQLCLLLSLIAPCFETMGLCADQPSHIVLIMTDDQGYGDLGFHGNPIVKTAHLDRLAQNSARLPNFIVSPVCTPTRASLMTGRYNYRTKLRALMSGRFSTNTEPIPIPAGPMMSFGFGAPRTFC